MASEICSAYHDYVALTLAREMNAYLRHSHEMEEKFRIRDSRGNPPVYTQPERNKTEELRLKITVFVAIYVEALANLYLSLKLTADQFAAIDRTEVLQKWTTIPSLFLSGYEIPKGSAVFCDLRTLISQRNAIAHMKPRIEANDEIIHEGNLPKRMNIHQQILRWDRLPGALIDALARHDATAEFQKFRLLSSIEEYTAIRKEGPSDRSESKSVV